MKNATIVATVLAVCCPHCGEPQPEPENGSDMWEPYMVRRQNGERRECVSCDKPFILHSFTKVMVSV